VVALVKLGQQSPNIVPPQGSGSGKIAIQSLDGERTVSTDDFIVVGEKKSSVPTKLGSGTYRAEFSFAENRVYLRSTTLSHTVYLSVTEFSRETALFPIRVVSPNSSEYNDINKRVRNSMLGLEPRQGMRRGDN